VRQVDVGRDFDLLDAELVAGGEVGLDGGRDQLDGRDYAVLDEASLLALVAAQVVVARHLQHQVGLLVGRVHLVMA